MRVGCATYLIVFLSFLAGGTSWLAYQKTIMPGVRYVAVRGDTIESVAARNSVGADALRAWNWGVDDPIEPNQVLMVWPQGRPFVEDIADAIHIVNDRHLGVAAKEEVSVQRVRRAAGAVDGAAGGN